MYRVIASATFDCIVSRVYGYSMIELYLFLYMPQSVERILHAITVYLNDHCI